MKNYKKIIIALLGILALSSVYAQDATFDQVIKAVGEQFSGSLVGNTVAIVGIDAPNVDVSEYFIDELSLQFVRSGAVDVANRANLDAIKKEMNFQLSGEVSDESMKKIGEISGASVVISGSLRPMGDKYRLVLRALDVTTAKVLDMSSSYVTPDNVLQSLMSTKTISKQLASSLGDYTTGNRMLMGFGNCFFGIGSFCAGHWGDGLLIASTQLLGYILIWDNGVPPAALVVGAAIYGCIRPYYYHRKNYVSSLDASGFSLALIPSNGDLLPQISYKIDL